MSGVPTQPAASNHWWSRSKSSTKLSKEKSPLHFTNSYPSLPRESEKEKPSSRLNTLASVIGLKPKKHNIAIQNPPSLPPSPQPPYSPDSSASQPSRPHSKAVSSITTTDDDVIEPNTPPDLRPSYVESVMAIPDPDPFASNGIFVPHNVGIPDSSKTSHLSDNSFSKHSTRGESVRVCSPSQASLSSRSHNSVRERLVSESAAPTSRSRPPINLTSRTLMVRMVTEEDRSDPPNDTSPTVVASSSLLSKDVAAPMHASSVARRPTRSRGMTDAGPSRPRKNSDAAIVLVRQPSLSRLISPPPNNSPPPSHALPPVPLLDQVKRAVHSPAEIFPHSPSSSCSLSCMSSRLEIDDNNMTTVSGRPGEDGRHLRVLKGQMGDPCRSRDTSPPTLSTGIRPVRTSSPSAGDHHGLRRAISQLSFSDKRPERTTSPSASAIEDSSGSPSGSYSSLSPPSGPKKQRSFHHPRVPVPPLPPLRHTNSFTPSDTKSSIHDTSRDKEKEKQRGKEKRGSISSMSRRGFFPGSMRRSSSQMNNPTGDDDSESILSSCPDNDKTHPCFINPFSSHGSEYNVVSPVSLDGDDLPSRPTNAIECRKPSDSLSVDYMPQHILSPADISRLEAEMRIKEDLDKMASKSMQESDHDNASEDLSKNSLRFGVGRPRGSSFADSVTSASSTFSDRLETASSISFFDRRNVHLQGRTDADELALPATSQELARQRSMLSESRPPPSSLRPSTSQGTINVRYFSNEDDQSFAAPSLPPPPRPRSSASRHRDTASSNRSSEVPIQPLSPAPVRGKAATRRTTSTKATSASSSVQRILRSAASNDVRRSIIKKPSFLDIEDEIETEMGTRNTDNCRQQNSIETSVDHSFLDLGRGGNSFDTIRTASMESPI